MARSHDAKRRLQARPASGHMGLHRAERQVQYLRSLGVSEFLAKAKRKRGALILG